MYEVCMNYLPTTTYWRSHARLSPVCWLWVRPRGHLGGKTSASLNIMEVARFCLLCLGVWTTDIVDMMLVHHYVKKYSLLLSGPSTRSKLLSKSAAHWRSIECEELSLRGPPTTVSVGRAPWPCPRTSRIRSFWLISMQMASRSRIFGSPLHKMASVMTTEDLIVHNPMMEADSAPDVVHAIEMVDARYSSDSIFDIHDDAYT